MAVTKTSNFEIPIPPIAVGSQADIDNYDTLMQTADTNIQNALDDKVDTSTLADYEAVSNKSTATDLGGLSPSNTLYPTQAAVKAYADAIELSGGGTPAGTPYNATAYEAGTLHGINTLDGITIQDQLNDLDTRIEGLGTIPIRVTYDLAAGGSAAPDAGGCDIYFLGSNGVTAAGIANAVSIGAPQGTPVEGQKLSFRIKSDATEGGHALNWNAIYVPRGCDIPNTTVASLYTRVGFEYNKMEDTWDCIAVAQEVAPA
jgi:hypothetical protein